MDTKACTKCGEIKPLSEYYKGAGRPMGVQSSCKVCKAEDNKASRLKNLEERRSRKMNAAPAWLSTEQKDYIDRMYSFRHAVSGVVGREYHVDHIVPLQGKNVCGLHVPWNLQVIPASDNLTKGNTYNDW